MHWHKVKLKLWQKMFLLLILSTAVLFNGAMLIVVRLNYSLQMGREKDRAATEEAFVAANLYKDMVEIASGNGLNYEVLSKNFEVYRQYYQNQGVTIELWHENRLYCEDVYGLSNRKELNTQAGMQNLLIRTIGDVPYLFVASQMEEPYADYQIVLSYSLSDLTAMRERMVVATGGVNLILMGMIMMVIFLILRKMMKPLEILSGATQEIAAGDYNKKIELTGEDEFVQLAGQFNRMSDSIAVTIRQLEEENEAKKQLIDNMAHELRTPLTAIQGYAEYIKMAKIGEEEKIEVLDYVIGQVRRLENLSNTLLRLARVREDTPECGDVKADELVTNLQHLFRERVESAHVRMEYCVHREELYCNRELILILLENLIENAIRACEENGRITVCFEGKDLARITVRDNGIGMEASELVKIQEPFYRVDKARSRKNGGVGLGVTLCRQIALYHNADLRYESEPGKGTIVTLQFQ